MVWKRVLLALGLLLTLGMVNASVFLSGTADECTLLKPGETQMYVLAVEQPVSGTYIVTLTSDGLNVYPSEITLYLEANKTATRWVKITAPTMVVDEYYTLDISVYRADTGELVESKQYCFHVYKGVLASTLPDVVFGYKKVEVTDATVYVTLYISNMSPSTVSATLDSDYGRVTFETNPVVVKPYRTVEVVAEIPVEELLPEYVTFYAIFDGGVEKKVTVRMPVPEALQPQVELEIPERIVVDSPLTTFVAKVTNNGASEITVVLDGRELPLGVDITSDEYTIMPGETVAMKGYVTADRVLRTGTFLSKICVKDVYGAELKCKYTTIELVSKSETVAQETTTTEGYTVTLTVNNGGKTYYGVTVEVIAPAGWKYTATPETFDLGAYEAKTVEVTFVPEDNAVDGTAIIRLVAPDGTVIAQKTVELKKSAITGYATAGTGGSVLGIIIAAIVIALIVALIIKKGREVEETEEVEEFAELTKKE
ncbi:MAG: hypothetical protein GXO00_00805 [Candidatus Diapherotrites archaeon]|nr:hypothetical protein [Candidatus Diapherotrites archaeon]